MDILALIGAFGGGVIGAYLGALPAFIMTGVVAVVGSIAMMTGAADISIGTIAFGSFLGPHIAFAGGVAAAAYAGKNKKIDSGSNIIVALNQTGDIGVIAVGGIFGVIGYLIAFVAGTVLKLHTDIPGITVICSAIIVRLAFGTGGICSVTNEKNKRAYFSKGTSLAYQVFLGAGIGVATSFIYASLANSGAPDYVLNGYPLVCFGIAATTLIFTQTGFAVPGTHHIMLISSLAAVTFGGLYGATTGAVIGVIFGAVAALIGDFAATTFNSNCNTHIDPPAFTIFTLTFIINLLSGNGFLG